MNKKNITLIGMMGVGKSHVAENLAKNLTNYIAVDSDNLVEYKNDKAIMNIFKEDGEEFFRKEEAKVLTEIYAKENLIVALGGGAFECEKNRELIKSNSCTIYLKATAKTLFERLQKAGERPLLKEGFNVNDVENILKTREANYSQADFTVDTDGKTPDEIIKEILGLING